MRKFIDYSFARPSAAGFDGVIRYLATKPDSIKGITAEEAADHHRNGRMIALVWETGAKAALGGAATARDHVTRANAEANRLNVPLHVPIYYAVDFETAFAPVEPYLKEVARLSVGPNRPAGVYGSYTITTGARMIGYRWTWQTIAWSYGRIDSRANYFQRQFFQSHDVNDEVNPAPVWGRDPEVVSRSTAVQRALRTSISTYGVDYRTFRAVWRLSAASRDGRSGFYKLTSEERIALQKNIGSSRVDGSWPIYSLEMPRRLRDAVGGVQVAMGLPITRKWANAVEGDAFDILCRRSGYRR